MIYRFLAHPTKTPEFRQRSLCRGVVLQGRARGNFWMHQQHPGLSRMQTSFKGEKNTSLKTDRDFLSLSPLEERAGIEPEREFSQHSSHIEPLNLPSYGEPRIFGSATVPVAVSGVSPDISLTPFLGGTRAFACRVPRPRGTHSFRGSWREGFSASHISPLPSLPFRGREGSTNFVQAKTSRHRRRCRRESVRCAGAGCIWQRGPCG